MRVEYSSEVALTRDFHIKVQGIEKKNYYLLIFTTHGLQVQAPLKQFSPGSR